ncbi:MAG: LysM peptidoglycan-binding domain-containing protein [Deferribacteres bacterium]|nr:LysM peptidoglycan-binding domain-containing protein [Deferribacteres bacterium]
METAQAVQDAEKAEDIPVEKIQDEAFYYDDTEDTGKEQNLLDAALDYCNAAQEFWSEGNLEKAIEMLDQAYALVLQVDTNEYPGLIQQKEDLRFMISKRILEIYASRYTAVNGNHNEIPLTMNEHVAKEIKRFQGPDRRFFLESYKRSGRYMNMIVAALKEAGLPEDLAWLPLIESGFKVRAMSRARALGLWQFISSTGSKFGLKRDTWVDERLDPEKSTRAAIAYLKELHNIFGDWTTVLAGYNCGEGTVLRTIRNQRINYLDNFWDLYKELPRETARYVPKFLATLHILKDPEKYGFTLGEPDPPVLYESVTIEKPVLLKTVARELGIPLKVLTELNPELRYQVTPATPYALKVPAGMTEVLLAKLEEIPGWAPPENAYVYHRVKKGETLSLIAMKYRTTVRKIIMANDIRRKHFIRVGQKLKIPLRDRSYSASYRNLRASKVGLPPNGLYRIKKGDSLWLIARRFNTNTKTLERINNLKSTRLYVGQVIKITETE